MATRAFNAELDRRSKEKIEDKKIAQSEKESKRNARVRGHEIAQKYVSDALDLFGKVVGSGAKSKNHPEWYKKYVGSFVQELPTYSRLGQILPYSKDWLSNAVVPSIPQQTAPGICVIGFDSSLPNTGQTWVNYKESPLNIGLSRLQAMLRKYNSRVGEYDPSDLGLYFYAAADIMFIIEKIRAGIKAYNTYSISNSYLAKTLVSAHGFNADDFFDNISEYKAMLKVLIKTFNTSILVPKNLTFILRRYWLAAVAMKDHPTKESQIYIFRQMHLGIMSLTEGAIGYSNSQTFDNVSKYSVTTWLRTMIRNLTDAVGFQTMMADLRAAMDESQFFKLPEADCNEEVTFTVDDLNLEQLHNIRTIPGVVNNSIPSEPAGAVASRTIHATNEGYLWQGTLTAGGVPDNLGPYYVGHQSGVYVNFGPNMQDVETLINNADFLNFYKDEVNGDDIIEATRLRVIWEYNNDDFIQVNVRGTEIPTYFIIYGKLTDNSDVTLVVHSDMLHDDVLNTVKDDALIMTYLSRFDWLPTIRFCWATTSGSNAGKYVTVGELDTYFPISASNLKLLHDQASYSEFFLEDSDFKSLKY